jgi:hypothetical protein
MKYKTPAALEMAVKQAAKNSKQDTNRAISGFYFHRLLCRVFDGNSDEFVLKGGQGMLARTIDARATRGIDLLSMSDNLDDALQSLRRMAEKNLDDFLYFEYVGSEPIKASDEYRNGLSVKFVPILGIKRMQSISIDLVVDEIPLDEAERLTPVDRIDVAGLKTCNYLVYPVTTALADKFCALHESHDGRPSSRVKDLVDIIIYATTCNIDGVDLGRHLKREISARKLEKVNHFALPDEWWSAHTKQYKKLVQQTGIASFFYDIDNASKLASTLFDPVLAGMCFSMFWDCENMKWKNS